MRKYKIVASKSQKKYTLVISADSESEARDKVHADGYSILSSSLYEDTEIVGKKFLFQIESNGKIKHGIIVGDDIFKVYMKLRDELQYTVICLYPEGDEAHTNAEKKQKIIDQLEKGYILKKNTGENPQLPEGGEKNSFYLKKELDEVSVLIQSVLQKLSYLIAGQQKYDISEETLSKLQQLYNKIIHIKSSTNISKLKEIGELALIKIGEIELATLEQKKDSESLSLLTETNTLLKQIGSDQKFIEQDKDFMGMLENTLYDFKKSLSFSELRKKFFTKKEKKSIDTESYSYLKTVLLLEKYQERLKQNTSEIIKNVKLFINPFSKSKHKETILLARNVIKQNISILKAKKTGSLHSYTGIKKGYKYFIEEFFASMSYFQNIFFICMIVFCFFFGISFILTYFGIPILSFQTQAISSFLIVCILFFVLFLSKNIFLLGINIVFLSFLFIFLQVNF